MHIRGNLGFPPVPTGVRRQAIDPVVPIRVIPRRNGLSAEVGPAGAGDLVVALSQLLDQTLELAPVQGPVQQRSEYREAEQGQRIDGWGHGNSSWGKNEAPCHQNSPILGRG